MSIKSDAKNGQQYYAKIGIGFISNFLLKAWVLYLTILKRKYLSLPLKVETDQFVICLILPVSFCQNLLHFTLEQWSESWWCWCRVNRDGVDAESPFPLFFSFSASFKNSSPRKTVGNCLRFGTGGWSLCFYPLLTRNIIFFPTLTMAARAKQISGKAICSRNQRPLSRFWARLRILNLIARLC